MTRTAGVRAICCKTEQNGKGRIKATFCNIKCETVNGTSDWQVYLRKVPGLFAERLITGTFYSILFFFPLPKEHFIEGVI